MLIKNLNLSKKTIIVIRLIALINLFCVSLFLIMYFKGWLPSSPEIRLNNINDYLGDDLWMNYIEDYNNAEIDNLPLKSQKKSITNYDAVLKLHTESMDQWLKNAVDTSSYISQYLIDNPECEINKCNSITIKIKGDSDVDYVTFSNVYDFGNRNEKLDEFDCIRISSSNERFISISDIRCFDSVKYLIVNIPISKNTDFSFLNRLHSVKELNLFVDDALEEYVKENIESMKLSYSVNIL